MVYILLNTVPLMSLASTFIKPQPQLKRKQRRATEISDDRKEAEIERKRENARGT